MANTLNARGFAGQPWMARFNTRRLMTFEFTEGVVDQRLKHLKLYHRGSPNPVALVAHQGSGFVAQLFIEQFAGHARPRILHAARVELQRCLKPSPTRDPWAAVRTPALTNAPRSPFRWSWPPKRRRAPTRQEGSSHGAA